jgi:hypothetical protein
MKNSTSRGLVLLVAVLALGTAFDCATPASAGRNVRFSLATIGTEARGQVVNNGDRFKSSGGYGSVGGRSEKKGSSLRSHDASQRAYGHYEPHCYFPEEWPKLPPWPPSANKGEPLLLNTAQRSLDGNQLGHRASYGFLSEWPRRHID